MDSLTQTVRDSFAKVLDQLGRTGVYHHFVRRKATMMGSGVNNIKDIAKHIDQLPLTGDGALGKECDNKLKDRKENNKEYKDLVPEITRKPIYSSTSSSQSGNRCVSIMTKTTETTTRVNRSVLPQCVTASTTCLRLGRPVRDLVTSREKG